MQNPFFAVFIFVVILFLYIHITSQWATSNDLEIYESDYESVKQVQEVCSVKQPVIFKFQTQDPLVAPFFDRFQTPLFEKYDNLDLRIKDSTDYSNNKGQSVDYVPISFRSARRLLTTDTTGKYFSEKNGEFLEESGLDNLLAILDGLLKPPLTAVSKHDMLIGSPHVKTPLRYRLESHNFLACTRGKIRVKMCPPKYGKLLPLRKDYENYEFIGTLNPWNTDSNNREDKDILSRIKFLDFELVVGDVLFLPPYWWYSCSFGGDADTTLAELSYDVAMNVLAQSKHWTLYYLQQSNIKTKPAKTLVSIDGSKDDGSKNADSKDDLSNPTAAPTSIPEEPAAPLNREIRTNAGTYVVSGDQID
jgi:hypothetical protein